MDVWIASARKDGQVISVEITVTGQFDAYEAVKVKAEDWADAIKATLLGVRRKVP